VTDTDPWGRHRPNTRLAVQAVVPPVIGLDFEGMRTDLDVVMLVSRNWVGSGNTPAVAGPTALLAAASRLLPSPRLPALPAGTGVPRG